MKQLSILLLIIALFSCCIQNKVPKGTGAKMRTIAIIDTLPYLSDTAENEEDNVVLYLPKEPILISFYKNYRLYRMSVYRHLDSVIFINDSQAVSKAYHRDTVHYYFAREGRDTTVYRIDSLSDPGFKKLPVDSLYRWNSIYKEPSINEDEFAEYFKKADSYTQGDFTVEKYGPRGTEPEKNSDTIYLFFSKHQFWDSIPFSLSFLADSTKQMKLVRIKLVHNGVPTSKNLFLRRSFIYSSGMREEKPQNEKELLETFLRFERFLSGR